MPASSQNVALQGFATGNLKIFHKAFLECGIGGRFSKFDLHQRDNWFTLRERTGSRPLLGFRIHDKIDRRKMKEVTSGEAMAFGVDHADWATYLHTAQKLIAKIIRPGGAGSRQVSGGNTPESRYFIDPISKNLIVANRMYVVEISPIIRPSTYVTSPAVFRYLDSRKIVVDDTRDTVEVKVEYNDVIVVIKDTISGGSTTHVSLMSEVAFEALYGEEV